MTEDKTTCGHVWWGYRCIKCDKIRKSLDDLEYEEKEDEQ